MTLDEYLTQTGESAETFARRAGVSAPCVVVLRGGQLSPNLETAECVSRATGGAVSVAELRPVDLPTPRATRLDGPFAERRSRVLERAQTMTHDEGVAALKRAGILDDGGRLAERYRPNTEI